MSWQFKKKMAFILSMAIFFVAIDRLLKAVALTFSDQQLNLVGDFLKFSFEKNYHIAFSLPANGWILNIIIGIIIIILIIIFFVQFKKQDVSTIGLLSLVILGASSNLFDRFKFGFVIDYLDLKYFTVFNLADAAITGAIIGLILVNLKIKNYAN